LITQQEKQGPKRQSITINKRLQEEVNCFFRQK
jgi:hypothetical protein